MSTVATTSGSRPVTVRSVGAPAQRTRVTARAEQPKERMTYKASGKKSSFELDGNFVLRRARR